MAGDHRSDGSIRWGILGSGKISSDMCNALTHAGSTVRSVAARSEASAIQFASVHKIPKAYGSYSGLLAEDDIDIVYIGTIHTSHAGLVLEALEHGKHVLCEKPFGMNSREVEQMQLKAKEKNLFLMENMWTRSFPATRYVEELISSKSLGEVVTCHADLGFNIPESVERLYDLALGGGGLLDLGIYPLAWVMLAFKGQEMRSVSATARLHKDGADTTGAVTIKYGSEGLAVASYSTRSETQNNVEIGCTHGKITVHGWSGHCPEKVTVKRGGKESVFLDFKMGECMDTIQLSFNLPKFSLNCPMNFPNSEGFLFQVLHVEEMLKQNKKESDFWTSAEISQCHKIMDEVRKQIGVVYPQD